MVATASSSGVVKSSSQCASGYNSANSRLMRRARRVSASGLSSVCLVGGTMEAYEAAPTDEAEWRRHDRLLAAAVPARPAQLHAVDGPCRGAAEPGGARARVRALPRGRQPRGAGHVRPRGHRFGVVAIPQPAQTHPVPARKPQIVQAFDDRGERRTFRALPLITPGVGRVLDFRETVT